MIWYATFPGNRGDRWVIDFDEKIIEVIVSPHDMETLWSGPNFIERTSIDSMRKDSQIYLHEKGSSDIPKSLRHIIAKEIFTREEII